MSDFEHKRAHRVAHLIQQELGQLFVEGLKDPRIGFVTVTEVRVTDDLKSAHIYVSILGSEQARRDSLAGLHAAAGFLKREIGKRLKLRFTPELTFAHDTTLDGAQRLQQLFAAVARGEHDAPPPTTAEALPPVETDRIVLPPEPVVPKRSAPGRSRRRLRKGSL